MVFPALAGVIPEGQEMILKEFSFSRTRGGDPSAREAQIAQFEFFPHSRG